MYIYIINITHRKHSPIINVYTLHRQSIEISLMMKRIFQAAILTELFPQSVIDVYVQIIQSDGGKKSHITSIVMYRVLH